MGRSSDIFTKDASKKIKETWQPKGCSGEYLCTIPSYGYMKDPGTKTLDCGRGSGGIVQKIFSLCVDGPGPTQIAKRLQQNNVLSSTVYAHEKGFPVCNAPTNNPYKWKKEPLPEFWSG